MHLLMSKKIGFQEKFQTIATPLIPFGSHPLRYPPLSPSPLYHLPSPLYHLPPPLLLILFLLFFLLQGADGADCTSSFLMRPYLKY